MNVEKIKTGAFALKYRMRGYKLLQNPKGTNPYEVTMMKNWFGFDGDRYDKHYHYNRVHRELNDGKSVVEKSFLMSTHLMTPDKKFEGKNITYSMKKGDTYIKKEKEYMSQEMMENRPLPKWCSKEEEFEFGDELFIKNADSSYYRPRPGIMEILYSSIIEKYSSLFGIKHSEKPLEPSFWQILKSNLNGGGMVQ